MYGRAVCAAATPFCSPPVKPVPTLKPEPVRRASKAEGTSEDIQAAVATAKQQEVNNTHSQGGFPPPKGGFDPPNPPPKAV